MRRDVGVVGRRGLMDVIVLHSDRLQVACVASQLGGSLVQYFRHWMIRWILKAVAYTTTEARPDHPL